MTHFRAAQTARRSISLSALTVGLICLLVLSSTPIAHATGTAWLVNRPGDEASDGDLATHQGTLRFALTHATSGDLVTFGDVGADIIFVGSTLIVPAGVALGGRDQNCGQYNRPGANIEDASQIPFGLDPIFRLEAGATLHNVAIGGGRISVRITGDDVDVCGVALGIVYDGEGNLTALPPTSLALSINGARASIRRNYIGKAVVVGTCGSDTRIGDTIDGSGDGNDGIRSAAVTVLADSTGAAQRVTIRDPFPRGLFGMIKPGVFGGDDDSTHANNWAQTPTIASARTSDGVTVQISGMANPLSLVDIYLDNQVTITRGTPVMADATGVFSFSGPLPQPGTHVEAIAASTLADPAHPNRVGSSSEWSSATTVISSSAEPLLSSLGSVIDLSGPDLGPAHRGDLLRFSVTMTNVGPVDLTHIHSIVFQASPSVTVLMNSGKVQGEGTGFIATDSGFSGGTLATGKTAVYSLDAVVNPLADAGMAVFSLEVGGDGIVSTPVVGRMRIVVEPAQSPQPRIWLPLTLN